MNSVDVEMGRGTKGLIGMVILSASILGSTFVMGMKIQRLIDGLITATKQHETLLEMKPCRQN